MNITLWALQSFVAFTFFYSGICKSIFSRQKLVSMGQTGVEAVPVPFIRYIGAAEILGTIGIILPCLLHLYPVLTPISAFCLALIMPFAAGIHYRRKEYKSVFLNCLLFLLCLFIAYGRTFLVDCDG